jgi:membrane dipeptidase
MVRKSYFIVVFLCLFLFTGCPENYFAERALRIHDRVLTVDTHVDTPTIFTLLDQDFDLSVRHDPDETNTKVDYPRMQGGGLDAVFFAAFVWQRERTPEGNANAIQEAQEMLDGIHHNLELYPDMAELALTPDDAYRLEKSGKRAIFICIENGYAIGNDLSLIEEYYNQGVRYMGLCHFSNNDICDSATDPEGPEHNGLSDFGREVVAEMNRLGMMVDVSHISDEAFYDVLEVSTTPVIASHSGARAIHDYPRHMNDDMLKKLAENGGVIQVLFMYVREPDPQDPQKLATVADVVDHIDHIVAVIGIDHVGIGSDFDGGGEVEGCFDVSQMTNITIELVKRGYSEEQIKKIWGGNFMRVFREVEEFAEN